MDVRVNSAPSILRVTAVHLDGPWLADVLLEHNTGAFAGTVDCGAVHLSSPRSPTVHANRDVTISWNSSFVPFFVRVQENSVKLLGLHRHRRLVVGCSYERYGETLSSNWVPTCTGGLWMDVWVNGTLSAISVAVISSGIHSCLTVHTNTTATSLTHLYRHWRSMGECSYKEYSLSTQFTQIAASY